MSEGLQPEVMFDLIASHVPSGLRPHLLIVGSVAAAYHHRAALNQGAVRTKDADMMIHPAGAIAACRAIAQRLLDDGWRKTPKCFPREQADDPDLRAIRLWPPSSAAYFVELLGFPEREQTERQKWIPIRLADGWYGLPSFRFLGLVQHGMKSSSQGIQYAAPSMMALANVLSHSKLGEARMSEPIGGRALLRSAKDLGRVLALVRLASRDELEGWGAEWANALAHSFPGEAVTLARGAGAGLLELLADPAALDEARHAVDIGLLAGHRVTVSQLRAIADQLFVDVIEPLEPAVAARSPERSR